jgi:hypothetical protein
MLPADSDRIHPRPGSASAVDRRRRRTALVVLVVATTLLAGSLVALPWLTRASETDSSSGSAWRSAAGPGQGPSRPRTAAGGMMGGGMMNGGTGMNGGRAGAGMWGRMPVCGAVSTERSPAMMWNSDSRTASVSPDRARAIAARWLADHRNDETVASIDACPGYDTVDTVTRGTSAGFVVGMTSENATSGAVRYHTWHGAFVAREDS